MTAYPRADLPRGDPDDPSAEPPPVTEIYTMRTSSAEASWEPEPAESPPVTETYIGSDGRTYGRHPWGFTVCFDPDAPDPERGE